MTIFLINKLMNSSFQKNDAEMYLNSHSTVF